MSILCTNKRVLVLAAKVPTVYIHFGELALVRKNKIEYVDPAKRTHQSRLLVSSLTTT